MSKLKNGQNHEKIIYHFSFNWDIYLFSGSSKGPGSDKGKTGSENCGGKTGEGKEGIRLGWSTLEVEPC